MRVSLTLTFVKSTKGTHVYSVEIDERTYSYYYPKSLFGETPPQLLKLLLKDAF